MPWIGVGDGLGLGNGVGLAGAGSALAGWARTAANKTAASAKNLTQASALLVRSRPAECLEQEELVGPGRDALVALAHCIVGAEQRSCCTPDQKVGHNTNLRFRVHK